MTISQFNCRTHIAVLGLASVYLGSCGLATKSSIEVKKSTQLSASMTAISPPVAKASESITVTGTNLSSNGAYIARFKLSDGSIKEVPVSVIDSTKASFLMPEGLGLGEKSVEMVKGTRTITTFSVVADEAANTLSIFTGEASKICSTDSYIDKTGAKKTGTKNCSSGSSDLTNLTAGNIKSGVTIAGVTGQYPSAAYTLSGSSGADLTTATFNAQIKSSAIFQYFDSAGTRYAATGDTNITAGNIANGVSVFGLSGTLTGGTAPNAWDVRVGTTINGVTGKLKVSCRNRVRSAVYNSDAAVGSLINTGITSGTAIDYWDTIDDYNNSVSGLPTSVVSGWTDNDCGGVETTTDDVNVWKDVTTAGSGVATCAGSPENCTMKDKITGLHWSKKANFSFTNSTTTNASATLVVSSTTGLVAGMAVVGTGIPANAYIVSVVNGTNLTMSANATATASTVTVTVNTSRWNGAVAYCDGLNHNGATDWRIPTQKELLESYAHGVRSAASANWITEAQIDANYFWSGSSVSVNPNYAWYVYLAEGFTLYSNKTNPYQVVCVR